MPLLNAQVQNAFSVDVEDFFHGKAFEYIPEARWDKMTGRVERNVELILSLLDRYHIKATFFFLGWVGSRYPSLTRQVHSLGHEIASHGYWHRIGEESPREFYQDIDAAKKTLEDTVGAPVYGHRLPSFDSKRSKDWFLHVVAEAGYLYDSSLYPAYHPWYRWSEGTRKPHRTSEGIFEIPMSCVTVGNWQIPLGGGGYLRILPACAYLLGISMLNRRALPGVIYVHPHDLDPDSPAPVSASRLRKLRRKIRIGRVQQKLEKIFQGIKFTRMIDLLPGGDANRKLRLQA